MAGDYIIMRLDLEDDPDVIVISALCGIEIDAVVGKLHKLWSWADKHTRDGYVRGILSQWIDTKVNCPGFFAALVSVGWMRENKDGVLFVDFDKHNGKNAKSRADGRKRQAKHRAKSNATPSQECNNSVTKNCHQRREEKRREENNNKTSSLPPPEGAEVAVVSQEIPTGESEEPKYDRAAMRAVVDAWNSIPDVKKCQRLTPARERSLNARLTDKFFRENWRRAIELVVASDFLRGKVKPDFLANFEFFLNESSFTKIVEGNYANRGRAGPGSRGLQPLDFSGHEQHFVEMDFDEFRDENSAAGSEKGSCGQGVFANVEGSRESGP